MISSASGQPPALRTVRVALGAKAYDVLIGRQLLPGLAELLTRHRLTPPYIVVHDDHLRTQAHQLHERFGALSLLETPAGEKFKSILQLNHLLRRMAEEKIPRSGTVIALGGGVIGDLAGFAASSYLRGVNLVQMPTTLLAMVDSSVGGKTGINLPEGKNLVGAFHQPRLVVADLDTLSTLPPREFAAGMAEVIKYGAIADAALFDLVAGGVNPTDSDLVDIIARCVENKARIVEQDEFETSGLRALLNFGHTLGHAIEKATGYERYLHGEAIAIGMRAAVWLSVWQAGLPEANAKRLEAALVANHLPIQLDPAVDPGSVLAALGNDKKVAVDGQNRWVLLKELGKAESGVQIPSKMVTKATEYIIRNSS